MIIDDRTEFSDAQAVTASAISDVIDTGATPTLKSIGMQPMVLGITVDETVTAAGAATVTFSLESDSTANLATSATVHCASAAIPKATLVAGYKFFLPIPPNADVEQYLGVRFTVGTGPLTAGKFSTFLQMAPAVNTAYPDAVN